MAFTIDESFLPATLTARPMTDQQFADFCSEHPDLFFEMTAEAEIIVMAPTFSLTGLRNSNINSALNSWEGQDGRGVVSDSSTGFVLPSGARRSPDASWTERRKLEELGRDHLEGFWHLCPDFVIELKSHIDRIAVLRRKMHEWIANGAQLGWLIDPDARTVEIYRPDRQPEALVDPPFGFGRKPVSGVRPGSGEGLEAACSIGVLD
jgi:Uma2 family endonuclease